MELGIPAAIVISAGFKEHGEHGKELEAQICQIIRGKMRLIGPNCLGVMNPLRGLNATFAHTIARPGNVAFISQSGALCTAVLDWSLRENVGFSAFVSIGSMLDVDWGDLIDYFGSDPRTNSIVIYMESIGDARAFLSAAREVSLTKPIIVIKAGRTAAAAKAAASHTGALTGSDEVLDAAFRRCGVLRVNSIADIFFMSEVLAKQPRPRGTRLTILTNAGGPGVLATDALVAGGGELAELSPETMQAFDEILPPHWSHNNPIDILGDAEPERYAKSLEIAAKDPGHRRHAGDPDAAGHDRSHADRREAEALRQGAGQAGAGQLDGRRGSRRGRANPEPGRHSDLPVSRHRGARLQLHVAVHLQPEGPLRNADAAAACRCRAAAWQGEAHSSPTPASRAAPS